MVRHRLLLVGLFAVLAVAWPVAQGAHPTIKWVTMRPLDSYDGHYVYDRECAVCHGALGRGDGRATAAIGVPVPDLSLIALQDGAYRPRHVMQHITDARHGVESMPDWGSAFDRTPGQGQLVSSNLARYIQTLQRSGQ